MKFFNLFRFCKNKIDEARQSADFQKGFDDFTDIILNKEIGDSRITVEKTICKSENNSCSNEKNKIGFIVFATRIYFSKNFIESFKLYAQEGARAVFVVDRTIKNNKAVSKALGQLKKNKNISVCHFSRGISTLERLRIALDALGTEYAVLFTMKDTANRRSLITCLDRVTESCPAPVILHSPLTTGEMRQSFLREPAISALSGAIFRTSYLQSKLGEIKEDWDFWVPHILFSHIQDSDIALIRSVRHYWCTVRPSEISINDLGYLCRDADCLARAAGKDYDALRNILDNLLLFLDRLVQSANFTGTKTAYLASGMALLMARLYKVFQQHEYRELLYRFASVFNFDQMLKNASIHEIHAEIVKKVIPLKKDTVAVVETDFMQDLKSCFVPCLKKRYNVIYVSKPQYYDYHFFYCMVMRALVQPASYIVTSNDMHAYITSGKTVLTLWHGSGMLKEIAFVDRSTYPMDYLVTSSEACVVPWSEQFGVEARKILPLGQVQTDIMFDRDFAKSVRNRLAAEYNIPDGARIIFFAPTFRVAEPGVVPGKYYDFRMDIEALSEKLAERGAYLITKKHHVFSHILLDKGIDASGVHPSKNGHFIVDETHDFQELVSAADVFVTDYSSGLFYAVVRDMPVVLYAPDLEEYRKSANGLMIRYPEEMAGVFVGRPDIDAFMKAVDDAGEDVFSERYRRFKEKHVAACDGHVAERLMRYLETWDGTRFSSDFGKKEGKVRKAGAAPVPGGGKHQPEKTDTNPGGKNNA